MASNQIRYVGNARIPGALPLRKPGNFNAGSTTPLKKGEFVELDTGVFVPLGSDKSMAGTIAISDHEMRPGDLAGYRMLIVPDEDDLFVVSLATPAAPALGDPVYWASSQSVALAGSNILGYVFSHDHYPIQMDRAQTPYGDAGTTKRTVSQVVIVIKKSVSYNAALRA